MWPFKTRIVDDETVDWQIEAFEWFIRTIGSRRPISATTLAVPGLDHFVSDGEKRHRFAERIFTQVRAYAGIDSAATIRLVAQPKRQPDILGETIAVVAEKQAPLGTFWIARDGVPEISYDPDLVNDPENLISTFAHELSHYLVPPGQEIPVSEGEYEVLTDLCVAFLGFGVFLGNTRLERTIDGAWIKWRGGGYLSVNDRVVATALFVAIKDNDEDRRTARQFLRPHLRRTFDKAFAQLGRFQTDIDRLRLLDTGQPRAAPIASGSVTASFGDSAGMAWPIVNVKV